MQDAVNPIPHLTTAMDGPLAYLEKKLLQQRIVIERWLRKQWRETPTPPYCSVDLRNAGFKIAPVDTNLFPAGFNNLNPAFMPLCIQAVQSMVEQTYPGCNRILLIPENHTRNQYYFESVAVLQEMFSKAGFDIRIGTLLSEIHQPQEFVLNSGRKLVLEPLQRKGNRIGVENFDACMVLLNNDLSTELPAILQNIEQPLFPPAKLGWAYRTKSNHFRHYQQICEEFAKLIDLDPWLINPLFDYCEDVSFLKRQGEDQLVEKTAALLKAVQQKYQEHGITHKPFVVIKADAGTYGMGIMMVQDAEEIRQLNRKERTRMSASKGGQAVSRVIIQEGVYTFETWGKNESVAEPVIYMIGNHVVGGFYRVHTERGINENLNAPGMHFEPLAFVQPCNIPDQYCDPADCTNRFYAYGVIARLALVAASRELKEVKS